MFFSKFVPKSQLNKVTFITSFASMLSSFYFVFFKVGTLYLLYVLIILHDHELPESSADYDTSCVVLRW